ncbi:MAG: PIG-L family deacetylase [Bacteroidota bacterium]|nr:PIG-L family deacetylase [Bacteroidota bacterium]MDP4215448.1 PIG-L family deacetylase [Bacteroidota bacterium]MDP4244845.1 PIG-L family deacetylase [Bacteroidota bacterium]MDP4257508.1 PIG-L family deacetylase [Bacteroidota bacterium]
MRIFLISVGACLILATGRLCAQAPETLGSAEIFLRLKKLNVLGSVLYVAAHPDDENSRLIAYMAKDRLYHTGYLSMTRGDGGQNLIGDEQGPELGLIRTQEMLAARRVDGADQFFTRAFDFGFSKSTEEALQTWDKQKILSDVVWVIRRFQPDVIITRFPEDSQAGHGHHSASAVLAHEAFVAAADPTRFPEQFKYGVKPWQAKRILWNTFNFGSFNTTSEDQMKIDVGGYNVVLGKSYGELAAESRTNHKSQGAALTPARGQAMEYFKLVAGTPAHADPMEDVVTTWGRVDGGERIQKIVDPLIKDYSLANPERSVPGLVNLYKELGNLKDDYWRTQKQKEVMQLIEACSGLWLEASVRNAYAVQGDSLAITFVMNNRLNAPMTVEEISVDGLDTLYKQELSGNKNYLFSRSLYISPRKPLTQPYWLAEEMSPGAYNVKDQLLIGDAQSPASFNVKFRVNVAGEELTFTRPVRYKFTDAVKGEIYQPVTVLPPVTGQFDPELTLFTDNEKKELEVQTKIQTARSIQPKMQLTPTPAVTLQQTADLRGRLEYSATPARKDQTVVWSDLVFDLNGKQDTARQLITISYDHIPRIDYFRPSKEKFVIADVKTAGRRIGYIEGAGDKVPEALQQMGYEVTLLREKDISAAYLHQFDAVITGVRAYDVRPWLLQKADALMDYVKEGGNLIVQYNRNNLGSTKPRIGPYPFAITNTRVTDETAKVNFLLPDHPVLNYPNKISDKDFDGWIQERGIYFAGSLDPAYETPLSMKDPGPREEDQKGSLVIASFGQGKFVYTGLVFFRELPAGVPGAYRLLANIIALNHKKGF